MYQFSDSESKDSDDGIRFKTDSTRNKNSNNVSSSSTQRNTERSRHAEDSPRRRRRRSRSRSSDRRRRHRSRERTHRDKERSESKKSESLSLSDEEVDRKKYPLKRKSSKHHRRRRSRSRRRESRHKENEGRVKDDNKSKNFQEASDDRTDPPDILVKKDNNVDQSESCLGPALPPHLLDEKPPQIGPPQTEKKTVAESACIGPALPPHLLKTTTTTHEPTLPPQNEQICIGPILPSHLRQKLQEESEQVKLENDEDVYGPLPPGMSASSAAHVALEERALQMKLDAFNPSEEKVKVREEWMLELPDVKAARLGLGPRQFRSRAGPDLSDRYFFFRCTSVFMYKYF